MKIKVSLKQKYNEIVMEFKSWSTAKDWIWTALLTSPDIKITIEGIQEEPAEEPALTDTDFND